MIKSIWSLSDCCDRQYWIVYKWWDFPVKISTLTVYSLGNSIDIDDYVIYYTSLEKLSFAYIFREEHLL
jgi:hypothetical protein